jgi:hypothetical protein
MVPNKAFSSGVQGARNRAGCALPVVARLAVVMFFRFGMVPVDGGIFRAADGRGLARDGGGDCVQQGLAVYRLGEVGGCAGDQRAGVGCGGIAAGDDDDRQPEAG